MKKFKTTMMLGVAFVAVAGSSSQAQSDRAQGAALGAALTALGVAAFKHHQHNHEEAQHREDAAYEANYERGYNDALYNAHFNTSSTGAGYREGYDAGQYEREHRVNHYRGDAAYDARHDAPERLFSACIAEVADTLNVPAYDVHPVRSAQRGNRYDVELAAGYRHEVCEVAADGRIVGMREGRI